MAADTRGEDGARSPSGPCLRFRVDVVRRDLQVGVTAYIGQPLVDPAMPDCWTCPVGWSGQGEMHRAAFGATSLQALSLGADMLAMLLNFAFPGAEFTEDGVPFLFSGSSISGQPWLPAAAD